MGIYIKGMKMPERCWDCDLCYDSFKLEDAIRAAESCTDSMEPISHDLTVELAVIRLKELPATEIVRCRDCVYHFEVPTEVKSKIMSVCGMRGMMITNRDGYCDMGIPRSAFGTVTRPAGKEGET